MNERIHELAGEAGLKVESWMTNPPKPFQIVGSMEEFEKFTELIVRECAKIADLADENKCEWIGGNILTHFGVGDAPVNDVDRILRTVRTRG